ncbi:MAG: hypothetical protein KDG51_16345 [Calditrichaeota bacterium]|nr:hypothetical protein [Calditrichota bacterium]
MRFVKVGMNCLRSITISIQSNFFTSPFLSAAGLRAILLALFIICSPAAFGQNYAGLWHFNFEKERILVGVHYHKFVETDKELKKKHFRLHDVEVMQSGGVLRYYAVWHSGRDSSMVRMHSWNKFLEVFNGSNMVLIDIETYLEGQERKFLGVWRQRNLSQRLVAPCDQQRFLREWERLEKEGYRLIDIETFVDRGVRKYVGVFHAGTQESRLWLDDVDWKSFITIRKGLQEQGFRLIDFEVYYNAKKQKRFIGVWMSGSYETEMWVDLNWSKFKGKWDTIGVDNMRLVDLEVY